MTNPIPPKDEVSNCCLSEFKLHVGDGGTNFFICKNCGVPCDIHVRDKADDNQILIMANSPHLESGSQDELVSPAKADYIQDEVFSRVIFAAMERGNLYDGYCASAEFNAKAVKVVDELLPILKAGYIPKSQALLRKDVEAAIKNAVDDLLKKLGLATPEKEENDV